MNCIICDIPVGPRNDSAEHIIANAIGGFRTVTGILCTSCNNTTGAEWDAELASQLNGMCHFFAIKRDRGSIPDALITTTAGEAYILQPDGSFALTKPTFEKSLVGDRTQYQIVARDKREARRMLQGLKKKHPEIDVEAILQQTEQQERFPEGMVHLPIQIGGELAGRTIVKSAVAFAHACSIPGVACERAVAYLRQMDNSPPFGYHSSSDLVVDRPLGVPFHCVAISGDPSKGLLLGYVEYFGFLRSVILLSERYAGAKIDRCYAIDPRNGQEMTLSVSLDFIRSDMDDIFDYKHCDYAKTQAAANTVIGQGMVSKREREFVQMSERAVNYAMANCGAEPGVELTDEQRAKLVPLMMEKIGPFIANLLNPRPQPHSAATVIVDPNVKGSVRHQTDS